MRTPTALEQDRLAVQFSSSKSEATGWPSPRGQAPPSYPLTFILLLISLACLLMPPSQLETFKIFKKYTHCRHYGPWASFTKELKLQIKGRRLPRALASLQRGEPSMLPCGSSLEGRGGWVPSLSINQALCSLLTLKAPSWKSFSKYFWAERTAASPNQASFFSLFFSFF